MIRSTSSPDLLEALEANMVAFWSSYGRADKCRLEASRDIVWFYTGIQHSICNGVVSVTGASKAVWAAHDALGQSIASQGAPAFWWIGPHSPAGLGAALTKRGLQPAGELPGMAIVLGALNDEPEVPADFRVEKVDTVAMQALWAKTCAIGTGFSEPTSNAFAEIEATLSDPDYRAQFRYLGILNDVPVASSALVLDSGVAGVYAVATIEAARRRGIGRYMTEMALREARLLGYRVGILQSSSVGHPIYRKIRFRDVCTYQLCLQS